uniref:Uncharacterized protein n=1 Tax=Romanomermis culicivorax TaxID=13658 RepID=A0A915L1J8_ROMCU
MIDFRRDILEKHEPELHADILLDRDQEVYILRIKREAGFPLVSLTRQERSPKNAETKIDGVKGVPAQNTPAQLIQTKGRKLLEI